MTIRTRSLKPLRIAFASPALSELLGLDPVRTVGRGLGELVHPDDAPILVGALIGPGRGGAAGTVRTARLQHLQGDVLTWPVEAERLAAGAWRTGVAVPPAGAAALR